MRFITVLLNFLVIFAADLSAEPARGWLNGEEDDFLQYECSPTSDGALKCSFTQVTMFPKKKPEEIDRIVKEGLPETVKQFEQEDIEEVCQYTLPMQGLVDALMRGKRDEAKAFLSKMPEKMRKGFDFVEAVEGISRLDTREMNDLRASFAAMVGLCEEPSAAKIESIMRLELEKEARTCKLWINNWTGTFRPISETIWSLTTDGPQGQCGVQSLDRFECKDGSYSCEFIAEKRVLNPEAEPALGVPCAELEERAFRYKHDGDGIYLDCNIVSFF